MEWTLTLAILFRKRGVTKDRPKEVLLAQLMYFDLTLDGNMTNNSCLRVDTTLLTIDLNAIAFLIEDNRVTWNTLNMSYWL